MLKFYRKKFNYIPLILFSWAALWFYAGAYYNAYRQVTGLPIMPETEARELSDVDMFAGPLTVGDLK